MIIAALICFLGLTEPQEIYSVSLRDDGAGQCCDYGNGTAMECTIGVACTLEEPGCCPNQMPPFGCCGIPQYTDCRQATVDGCFCQIQTSVVVTPASPCIDDVLAGETRVGWLRWLVLRTPGLQGTCGRIGG